MSYSTKYYIAAPSSARCADGYKEYNNKCWKFVIDDPKSWYDARTTCQMENAELATINSQEEMDFVFSERIECCSMYLYSICKTDKAKQVRLPGHVTAGCCPKIGSCYLLMMPFD